MLARVCALTMAAITAPLSHAFREIEMEHELQPQELSLIDSVGRAPCVFKLEDKFYDFTPVKLVKPDPIAPYYDAGAFPTSASQEPLY